MKEWHQIKNGISLLVSYLETPENLLDRLTLVRKKMVAAAERVGRDPAGIELISISKTQSVEQIREAMEAGMTVFGESRLQEAMIKIPCLPAHVHWHFIGHLQKNKIRKLLPLFELFHGVDNLELAYDMDRIAAELGLFPRVLLEINMAGESTKYGFAPNDMKSLIEKLLILPRLQVEGFMTMAPLTKDPETVRPFFSGLRFLRDELAVQTGIPLSTLSMGMSNDYEVAVEEGATMVRVGSAIFNRPPGGKVKS